ncbi:RagB/SusD family nutrient uptake outer membrane protein [Puteibacter caeruleilacunae]|nr:RagB/SusD family nutrient uptake outer membrane protein [Puteibacter caeruleilacunae]
MRNIKTKIKSGILLALMAMLNFSCGDDFLDEKPLSTLSPENTYVDAQGLMTPLDAALKAIMNMVNQDDNGISFDNMLSDVAVAGNTDKAYLWQDCNKNAIPTNGNNREGVKSKWFYEECFKHLKNANTVIDYIDNPEWTTDVERNHVLGSAYFIRAYFYYLQTMQFGNTAFTLNVISSAKQDFRTFRMQEIWQQMITDLEWAREYVKPANDVPKGRIGNSAVRLLLSKYYLLTNQYDKAEQECNAIINSGVHELVTDADVTTEFTKIGAAEYNGNVFDGRSIDIPSDAINVLHDDWQGNRLRNSEAILVFVNAYNLDASVGKAESMRTYGPNFGNGSSVGRIKTPDLNNGINDKNGKGEQMQKWGRGQGQMRPTNYSQYDIWTTNPNDPSAAKDWQDYRHKPGNWFQMSDVVYDNSAAGDWTGESVRLFNDDGVLLCKDTLRNWYGYPIYKFWAYDEASPNKQYGGHANLYLYRLAEVYLLRAEARFWQGDYQGAADDINVIRDRANAIYRYTAADVQNAGIGAVLDERARELYGEEFRSSELTRISIIFASSGKSAYNGKTYSMERLSEDSFWYDRVKEKNIFFKDGITNINGQQFTISPHHIFWPIYEPIIVANVGAVLNQTPGYLGDDRNVPLMIHKVQPAGVPNTDPMIDATEE